MITADNIVAVIQRIPADNPSIKFLVSLANGAFTFGSLTQRQEQAFMNVIRALKDQGVLA